MSPYLQDLTSVVTDGLTYTLFHPHKPTLLPPPLAHPPSLSIQQFIWRAANPAGPDLAHSLLHTHEVMSSSQQLHTHPFWAAGGPAHPCPRQPASCAPVMWLRTPVTYCTPAAVQPPYLSMSMSHRVEEMQMRARWLHHPHHQYDWQAFCSVKTCSISFVISIFLLRGLVRFGGSYLG